MSEAAEQTPLEEFVDDSAAEDIEKAKAIGWKAPKEWKGNPPKNGFVKAKEYLERAETVIPIMRSENKKLKEQLEKSERDLADFKKDTNKTVAKMAQMSKVALDRQRSQLEDKYATAIDKATEVGDTAEVRKLRAAEKEDLEKFDKATEVKEEKTEEAKKDVNDAMPPEVKRDIAEWIGENPWYTTEPEMQALANAREGVLMRQKPGLTTVERLAEVRKYVAGKFPDKFGEPEEEEPDDDDEGEKPPRGSRVEGGSRVPGGGSGSKWSRLPAEVKKEGDRFIKEEKLFLEKGETVEKDLSKARERYAAKYEEL